MDDRTPPEPVYEPWTALYGQPDGRWYLMAGPHESTPPRQVDGLIYLGTPTDMIRLLHNERNAAKQTDLAELLCVRQQAVSRYLNGSRVHLGPRGWENLVREVFHVGVPLDPAPVPT